MTATTTYAVQRTNPEFSLDASTKWHVVDQGTGVVRRYFFTKREASEWVRAQAAPKAWS